jgi:UDP-glucose 4-epimerase
MTKRVVVTGGSGFIGAHLVKHLVHKGWDVKVIDNLSRGDPSRLKNIINDIEVFNVDIRDEDAVTNVFYGSEVVMHLAAINGTENFYTHPELVLDVGIRGALAVVNACRRANVPDLVVASSAEVYQTPTTLPTPEDVALTLPNSLNPRYSYGGSKIISELIAFNYAREHFRTTQVFRPHNIYGPDMGTKHVIPQFIIRAAQLRANARRPITFPIQGSGRETRAFCYVDDAIRGIMTMYEYGNTREVFHIGNDEEVSIKTLAHHVGASLGLTLNIESSEATEGGTLRRCPDISKMRRLGYEPQTNLRGGLALTIDWYLENLDRLPASGLI